MKKITRAGILSLAFVLTFMFTAVFSEDIIAGRYFPPADKGQVFVPGKSMQAKHDYGYEDEQIIHLSKHELTLKKGQSYTLKASLLPGGKSVSVKWVSTNPKVARVSSSGKVTAAAPGTTMIWAESDEYFDNHVDETGYSAECIVTVQGSATDAKPLGTSDRIFSYGRFTFTAVTSKHNEALVKIQKNIGGYIQSDGEYGSNLLLGSKDIYNAHTCIYTDEGYGFYRIFARGISPLKTSRGITVGAKKNTVQQKYGLPTIPNQYTNEGRVYEVFSYVAKASGKNLYTNLSFTFLKSKGIIDSIDFYLGGYGDY